MCFILAEIKGQQDKESDDLVLDILKEKKVSNRDGTGIAFFNAKKDKFEISKAVNLCDSIVEKAVRGNSVFLSHQRIATSGGISEKNTHFWERGRWIFAHNGVISGLSDSKDIVDSLLFFKQLISDKAIKDSGRIRWDRVKKIDDSTDFWGRFILIDKEKKRIYFYGDFHAYLISDSTIIIASVELDFDNSLSLCGLTFEKDDKEYPATELEGINYFDLKKHKFFLIDKSITYFEKANSLHGYQTKQEREYTYPEMRGVNEEMTRNVLGLNDNEFTKREAKRLSESSSSGKITFSQDNKNSEIVGVDTDDDFSGDFYEKMNDEEFRKNNPDLFDEGGNMKYYWDTEDEARISLSLREHELIPEQWLPYIYELRNNHA